MLLNSFVISSESAERAERSEALAAHKVPENSTPLLLATRKDRMAATGCRLDSHQLSSVWDGRCAPPQRVRRNLYPLELPV